MTALSISVSITRLVYTIVSAYECYVWMLFDIKVFNLIIQFYKCDLDFGKSTKLSL